MSLEAWGDEGDVFEGCPCCELDGQAEDDEHVCHCEFVTRTVDDGTVITWCNDHDRVVLEA